MRVVGRRGGKRVGEETVVEEGAFEQEVDQEVEDVPDVQGAQFARGGGGEEALGEGGGEEEEEEGGEEGEEGGGG